MKVGSGQPGEAHFYINRAGAEKLQGRVDEVRTKLARWIGSFQLDISREASRCEACFFNQDRCKLNRTFIPALGKKAKKVMKKPHFGELAILPAPKVEALLGG